MAAPAKAMGAASGPRRLAEAGADRPHHHARAARWARVRRTERAGDL
jgi:hypothetical protein